MAVFRETLTDGIEAADHAEMADLENYAKALFDETCEAVRSRTQMSAGERKAFEAEATNFAESLKEIGEIGEKRLRLRLGARRRRRWRSGSTTLAMARS